MATNPFKNAVKGGAGTQGRAAPVKIAGSKNMTTQQVKQAGAKGGFSFKGSGRSQAYISAAKGALRGGATAAEAHRAASSADAAAYGGKQ